MQVGYYLLNHKLRENGTASSQNPGKINATYETCDGMRITIILFDLLGHNVLLTVYDLFACNRRSMVYY